MTTTLDLADRVHLVEHAHTNCYLLVEDGAVTVVDACFGSTWPEVKRVLKTLSLTPAAISALVLTHGHFDHVGFAAHLQTRYGVPVWVHAADQRLAAHPYRYRPEQNRALFPLRHPRSLPILASMVAAGALAVRGVAADHTFADGDVLDVPGRPRVVHLPGHTDGECAFHVEERSVLFSGDALVTLDPYTGRRGPGLVAPAATADSAAARASLDRLVTLEARTVLPGHGRPWKDGLGAAVALAQRQAAAPVSTP